MLDVVACWRHDPTGDVPGRVRRALTAQLRMWELRGIDEDDVALVLTELITNAVEHAHTPLTVTVGLRSTTGNAGNGGADGPVVRIEIADGSAAPPRPQPLDRWAARGRGLQMIEALTTGWGYTATATGKTVWAEFARPGPPSPDRERAFRRSAWLDEQLPLPLTSRVMIEQANGVPARRFRHQGSRVRPVIRLHAAATRAGRPPTRS